MLFFHKRWWLKKKKFPNRRTVLASAWSDRCGVTSRLFWPAVYWKKSYPIVFFFRARIIHVNVQCLPSRKKEERYWSTVAPENDQHLGPKNWVHYAQELRSFFLKGLLSSALKCSEQIQFLAQWLASRLVLSWTWKYRGWRYSVEWRTDGMTERNDGIQGIF